MAYLWACSRQDATTVTELLAEGVDPKTIQKQFKRSGLKKQTLEFFLQTHRHLPEWREIDAIYRGNKPEPILPCDRVKFNNRTIISIFAADKLRILFEMLCRQG